MAESGASGEHQQGAAAAAAAEPSQQELSEVIRARHHRLRESVNEGRPVEEVWRENVEDEAGLQAYAQAMAALARRHWTSNLAEAGKTNRVAWCKGTLDAYYSGGGREACVAKDVRRAAFHNLPAPPDADLAAPAPEGAAAGGGAEVEGRSRKRARPVLSVLDVGSCYNPFADSPQFEVLGIDIAPASDAVKRCDFTQVDIVPDLEAATIDPDTDGVTALPGHAYDAVVFSLLLSYFPTTEQRFECCRRARRLLKTNGLLLVVCPDSCHQGKHTAWMKGWKRAVETLGFRRWRYVKTEHLHCMAFRAVAGSAAQDPTPGKEALTPEAAARLMTIPQDRAATID